MTFQSNSQIDIEVLNIVSNSSDEKILDSLITNNVGLFPKSIESQFNSKLLRLSKEKIKVACQIVGCKPVLAKALSDNVFEQFQTLGEKELAELSSNAKTKYYLYTTKTKFLELFREDLKQRNLTKDRNLFDFELALSLLEQARSMIVLLGGTSGSGKSTVASVLASRFGIPTVLSTDSIRHIMRNFMVAEECPVLFCSTYEAGKKIKCDEDIKDSKRIVMGFQQQSAAVQQRLESILLDFYNRGESIVVEGVHLTPDFLTAMVKKFNNCIPFLIYISNEGKHRERFAVRSKYMTLDKRHNKYVENFTNIRHIQKHLTKKADEFLIPKVDNSNVDKSVGIVHRTLVRCLRRIVIGESLYDPENNNVLKIYEQFNTVTKNIWSSETVKKYIKAKGKKTYKNEIFKRFFEQNAMPLDKNFLDKIEPDARQDPMEPVEKENNKGDETPEMYHLSEKKSDMPSITKAKAPLAFKEDFILLDPSAKSYSDKPKATKEEILEGDTNYDSGQHYPDSPEQVQRRVPNLEPITNRFEDPLDLKIILGPRKSFEGVEGLKIKNQEGGDTLALSKSQENFKTIPNITERPENVAKIIKGRSEEQVKSEEGGIYQANSPQLAHKSILKLSLLEDALAHRRVLTIKGMTQNNIRTLKKFVDGYNARHHDYFLKLFQENNRIIIYKRAKNERESSPRQTYSSEITPRGLSRFATKKFEDLRAHENEKLSARYGETNTSEDNLEASDEESSFSVTSQEKWSNASGSLDVNMKMMKRGSTYYNLSDKLDISDEMEPEEDTSLEVIQSGNSISEQTIEEDEEEEVTLSQLKSSLDGNLNVNSV